MALNTFKCNHLMPLHFEGLNLDAVSGFAVTFSLTSYLENLFNSSG